MNTRLIALAPAKVNLTLRVGGRRADGLHELESLVAFAAMGDRLTLDPGRSLSLEIKGPLRNACGPLAENLVLKAAAALQAQAASLRAGRFVLFKRLPVAAGLGGGSADAAAALRLLAKANEWRLSDPRLLMAARQTGADVPVCLDPMPRLMRGAGEILSEPQKLPRLPVILVNPGIALATKDVFAAFDRLHPQRHPEERGREATEPRRAAAPSSFEARLRRAPQDDGSRAEFLALLQAQPNDLEAAAVSLQPAVGKVLAALRALPQCRIARMSGSGATCFALFDSIAAATAAARALRAAQPKWWVRTTVLGG